MRETVRVPVELQGSEKNTNVSIMLMTLAIECVTESKKCFKKPRDEQIPADCHQNISGVVLVRKLTREQISH